MSAYEATSDPLLGRTISGFRIEARIGHGGTSVVYRARNARQPQQVAACKVLRADLSAESTARQRFHNEAHVLEGLRQASISGVVEIYGLIDDEFGQPWIMLQELLTGESLGAKLRTQAVALPQSQVITWMRAVAQTLEQLHGHRTIHRDLKPDNIIELSDGKIKLIDFGIAAEHTDTGARLTQRGSSGPGTPGYMPPEQRAGARATPAMDSYAWGITTAELLWAEIPEGPVKTWPWPPDTPPVLPEMLDACLAPQASERPNMASILRTMSELEASPHPRTTSIRQRAKTPTHTGRARLLAGIVGAGFVLSIGTWFISATMLGDKSDPSIEFAAPRSSATGASPACPPGSSWVPGGRLTVSKSTTAETRRVTGLCVARREVSSADYQRCVSAGACPAAADTRAGCNAGREERSSHPINCIDAAAAENYCRFIGARLPRSEEWIWAASGGDSAHDFPWGGDDPDCQRAVYSGPGCSVSGTAEGGRRPAGRSRHGLDDLSGNVWEWTATTATSNRTLRIVMGGSWQSRRLTDLRAQALSRMPADTREPSVGLRCVSTPISR